MTDDDLRAILMQIRDLALKPYPLPPESKIEDQELLFILGQIAGLCCRGLNFSPALGKGGLGSVELLK